MNNKNQDDTERRRTPPSHLRRFANYRQRLLQGPQSMERLAELEGVSLRTIRRDFDFLRSKWEWAIRYTGTNRCWEAYGSMPIRALHLEGEEMMALLVAAPALEAYGSTPFAPALHSALKKIVESLDTPVLVDRPPVDFELLSVRETDIHLFQQFAYAARKKERLQFTYYSAERQQELTRNIDPYSLFNHEGAWYVTAYCHIRQGLRDFAISTYRVKGLEHTGIIFQPDPTLDLEAYYQQSFGVFKGGHLHEITLRFAPKQTIYQSERVPRAGETREPQPDGGLLIRFPAPVSIGVVRWVLQYGSEVEVLGPEELREWVGREHRKAVELYDARDEGEPSIACPHEGT